MVSLATIAKGVNSAIDLIQHFLPLIGTGPAATESINKVVDTMQEMAPLITDQISTTYTGVQNIIASVRSNPATTEEQLASLRAFSKQVDDAWDAIEAQLDPDAPGAA